MPEDIRDFTKLGDSVPVPPLTRIQTRSYEAFLQHDVPPEQRLPSGLEGLFREVFPIRLPDSPLAVEYLHYQLGPPAHEPEECRRLRHTYGYPLHARFRVVGAETIEDDVFLGEIPKMLGGGEFIIHGADRIVVSQIQRAPGIDFAVGTDSNGRTSHSCRIVPERGTWIELSISPTGLFQARVGQSGKMPGTWLLRAMLDGAGSDDELLSLFYNVETATLSDSTIPDLVGRRLGAEVINTDTGEVRMRAGLALDAEDLRR